MSTLPEEIKTAYLIAIGIIFLLIAFLIFFVILYKSRQTNLYNKNMVQEALLKQQKLEAELEKINALQSERDRISIDMHDDLGSGLSSIKLISEMLKRKHSDEETQNDLTQIVENATELTGTMRDMVWSLNPRNDNLDKFILHIQQYAKTFFEPSEIDLHIEIPKEIPSNSMSGFIRRNLFLCIKEVFNNIIKHSKANSVHLKCELVSNQLIISIQDNGIGLSENNQPNNGFYSMQKRIKDCNGTIEWKNNQPGLMTIISLPI